MVAYDHTVGGRANSHRPAAPLERGASRRGSGVEPSLRLEAPRAPVQSWRPGAALASSERYGRFEILGRIGRGGMAEILLARERGPLGALRHLVIKRILPEVADNDTMLHMFLDEARLVMGLSHPNLCQIYEIGEQDGSWFIAMEWVNGTTLHELIRRAGAAGCIDVEVMASIMSQCAEALHHAHHARDGEGNLVHLVHRDVSPHNIMVAFDGRVKLLDFGIAKTAISTHRTEAGIVKGKVCYLAPEQWRTAPVDARTDIFALGCCMFEALSGRVLFRRDSQAEVMRAVLEDQVPRLADEHPSVPTALSDIAARALAQDPEDRFQSALALSDAIEQVLTARAGGVRPSRIAGYVRSLFPAEVELGPVLERSVRGADLEEAPRPTLPSLPPVAAPLRAMTTPGESRMSLPPPPPSLLNSYAPPPPRPSFVPTAATPLSEAALLTMDVQLDDSKLQPAALSGECEQARPTREARPVAVAARRPASWRAALVAACVAVLGVAGVAALGLGAQHPPSAAVPVRPVPGALVSAMAEPALDTSATAADEAESVVDDTYTLEDVAAQAVLPAKPAVSPLQARPLHRGAVRIHRISVNTRPWSKVFVGKRYLGTTPLAQVIVPPGPLLLRFVDRDGMRHLRRVPAGKDPARSVFYDFAQPAK
jgi:eukaryotic-like serine/threonine-protein kinase